MPLPKPKKKENHDDFMGRCMGDKVMLSEYPDKDQRYAVCESLWEKSRSMVDGCERRVLSVDDVELRISDEGEGMPKIKGYAARFGKWSEDLGGFKRRKYCSLKCANTRVRPSHWGTYHWRARKHRKSYCEACGSTELLHAHHVDGNPKNNSKQNIQTLCVYCHNFLHATAERRGLMVPGRLPQVVGWTDLNASETG